MTRLAKNDGFTLLEVILVLALLVVIAAIALPNLRGSLDSRRLQDAGYRIRAELTRARSRAIREQRIYAFRYEIGGSAYRVEPWIRAEDEIEAEPPSGDGGSSGGASYALPSTKPRRLDESVTFLVIESPSSQSAVDALGEAPAVQAGGSAGAQPAPAASMTSNQFEDANTGKQWSLPVLLYPSGEVSRARIVLKGGKDRYVTVTMRPLTGVAKVSDLLLAEELAAEELAR